jgi:UDP-N-acetylmuramoylalanine--D-glutamate ligase
VYAREAPTFVLTLPDSGPRIAAAFEPAGQATAPSAATAPGARSGTAVAFAGVTDCRDLGAAVAAAFDWARPDGIVLLSPAAPSFGHFRDYQDRAEAFTRAFAKCSGLPSLSIQGQQPVQGYQIRKFQDLTYK